MPIVVPDAVDILTVADIQVFFPKVSPDLAQALIDGAVARAVLIAPCLDSEDFSDYAAAKGIIRDVVLRRVEGSTGVLATQTAGPFAQSFDTRTSPRVLFYPAEIAELQRLCQAQPNPVADTAKPTFKMPPPDCPEDLIAPGARRPGRTYVW